MTTYLSPRVLMKCHWHGIIIFTVTSASIIPNCYLIDWDEIYKTTQQRFDFRTKSKMLWIGIACQQIEVVEQYSTIIFIIYFLPPTFHILHTSLHLFQQGRKYNEGEAKKQIPVDLNFVLYLFFPHWDFLLKFNTSASL